jgi:hypothetical protein
MRLLSCTFLKMDRKPIIHPISRGGSITRTRSAIFNVGNDMRARVRVTLGRVSNCSTVVLSGPRSEQVAQFAKNFWYGTAVAPKSAPEASLRWPVGNQLEDPRRPPGGTGESAAPEPSVMAPTRFKDFFRD